MADQREPVGYFYDGQIGRYLKQIIRIFSNFYVLENTELGKRYNRVPARYGDPSRMAEVIKRKNSENIINSAPFMTISVQSVQPGKERQAEPRWTDIRQVVEREYNRDTNSYTSEPGNLYTVERYMPVPYNLTINLDIWSTNTDSKLQLFEQISVLFNTTLQLQVNQNPLDWSSVFEFEMTDIQWSSRSIPVGTENPMDIMTIVFTLPIWISPPSKVKKQTIIQSIVSDIHTVDDIASLDIEGFYDFFGAIEETSQVVVTPGDFFVRVVGNEITLLDNADIEQSWDDLIAVQGQLSDISKIKLNISNEISDANVITGFIREHPTDGAKLIFDLDEDTLPQNTLLPVDRIIDPRGDGHPGGNLPVVSFGQRYLLAEDLASEAWSGWGISGDIVFKANDIIEYVQVERGTIPDPRTKEERDKSNGIWQVVFDSSENIREEFLLNSFTNDRYKWTGTEWISVYEGVYNPGYWSLVL